MEHTWLALDIGTSGAKAAVVQGDVIRQSAVQAYPLTTDGSGLAEQQAGDWWQAALAAARQLDLREVEAIAITGQMQDVILVDAAGAPVRPVILYSDSRAHSEIDTIHARIPAEELTVLTGNEQTASSLLAKLLWLLRHEPDALARSRYLFVGAADFIAYQMTGVAVCDTTTASTTGLLDLGSRQWLALATLERLGLAAIHSLLPPVQRGGQRLGLLLPVIAQQMGLPAPVPVYHGPGDAGATTLGVGSGEPGNPYGYVGTSGWVGYTAVRRGQPETGVFTLAHPDPRYVICVAPILTAGGNVDWAKTLLHYPTHDALIERAYGQPPTRLLYLPYLNGERSPFSDPWARGAFIGLNSQHTADDLARAVLEGVALAYRHALDALLEAPPASLTLTGGGASSQAGGQLYADVIQLPVTLAAAAENVGVRGAILAAQVAAGQRPAYALAAGQPAGTLLRPDATQQAHYAAQYALFRQAYPLLQPLFRRMGEA